MWLTQETKSDDITIKCLVLGDYGRGKSWFASTFPDPIAVLDFDDGKLSYMHAAKEGKKVFIYNEMLDPTVPIQTRWSKLISFLDEAITTNKQQFKTLVLDRPQPVANGVWSRQQQSSPYHQIRHQSGTSIILS